ncbi:MAG: GPI inositol-deacylase [Deltaproteobacteria bacterium]|nr:GPI inositol-deacylase [Deltaproteobacteria bacterium]
MDWSAKTLWESTGLIPEKKPRWQALLNGLIGDTLAARDSSWAIPMSLSGEVRGDKLCILVHGLCDSEETWRYDEEPSHSYGALLQRDLGYCPLFLRYNSGLHISTNGRLFSEKIEQILGGHPEIREVLLIGHSMGGLVIRSACHYGSQEKAKWVPLVKKIFFLGVPHLGSDWEKLGHVTSLILNTIPNPVTWGLGAIGNKRSAGIKDLRFGYLLDEDWQEADADLSLKNHRHPVPLMDSIQYHVIAASLAKESDNIFTRSFGDGLVAARSVAGRSYVKSRSLEFHPDRFKTFRGLSHSQLASHPEVYDLIKEWAAASA